MPEKAIGASFHDEPLSQFGFWADWKVEPKWNLCDAPGGDNGGKVEAVKQFLDSGDKVLVCTHATFRFAVEKFGVEVFDDRLIAESKSDHPFVAQNRDIIHKIGVTGGDVKSRIANARKDPTYLLADVEIVATYKLANIHRKSLEALLHKFFGKARLDLELKDRFGAQVEPREWFLVPLAVIDEAIQKLKDGTLDSFRYDPETAGLTAA